jgi:hypothetical protein
MKPMPVVRAALGAAVIAAAGARAWAQAPAVAKPIATAASNAGEGVSVDLMSVERKGSVLTVKWAVRNAGKEKARVSYGLVGKDQSTYVLDEESGTKYYVLTDKEKHGLASEHKYIGADTFGIDEWIEPGATLRYWMKLPAPPPAVKTINVFLTKVEPFESVAIADR